MIAVGIGPSVDLSVLRQLTENVLSFTENQEGDFSRFIQWITASVTAHSRSVGEDSQPPLKQTDYIVKLAKDDTARAYDENCVVLTGRCSKTRRPYLIKYERPPARVSGLAFDLNLNSFNIAGCYPVDEDYFSWTDMSVAGAQINTSELHGVPGAHTAETVVLLRCVPAENFSVLMGLMM